MLPVAVALVVDDPIEVAPEAEPPITTLPVAAGLTIMLVVVDAVAEPPITILPVALYVAGAPHGIGNETGKLRGQHVVDDVALPPMATLPVADAD